MFPTSRFRIAYDSLKNCYTAQSAASRYLKILYLAAKDSEVAVDNALMVLIKKAVRSAKMRSRALWNLIPPIARPNDIHIL